MRIAVTGASGTVGGQVATQLAAYPEHDVVALVRPATRWSPPPRVLVAPADYADPATLRAALDGVDTLVFVSSDGHAATVMLHHVNVVQAAADCGVGHVVVLSGLDVDVESPFCYAVTNGHTERLLASSGCAVSVARASIYTEFFLRLAEGAVDRGQLRLPAGDGRLSLVSRTDVARSLAALALAGPTGRRHDITGPSALDVPAIAAAMSAARGDRLEYIDVDPADYTAALARAGETSWWAHAYSTMLESVRHQRWGAVSDEVARLTGTPPASVHDVLTARSGTPCPVR
ncbi:NAD(P)H-binding protein [Jiangella gansuensis]|uniref:NAD(P)H-binding protein n=1 Tax=Jiangella gansuensis TaxID=281473 RepID=UPI0004BBB350|nr:NAD(P)H-binding protein [Jiangella gansuensis]